MSIAFQELYTQTQELKKRIQFFQNDPLHGLARQLDAILQENGVTPPELPAEDTEKDAIISRLQWLVAHNERFKAVESQLEELSDYLSDGADLEHLNVYTNCTVGEDGFLYSAIGHRLSHTKLQDDLVFVRQQVGFCEDDFYGTLYFPVDDSGTVSAVSYEM